MWCVMYKCQHQLVCYGLYPSSACFCYFLKQEKENKMSACISYVSIIFRPRQIALFSSSFLFIFSLHSLPHIENCNAQECFSKQGHEKWPTDTNFLTPTSTGCKVEMLALMLRILAGVHTFYYKAKTSTFYQHLQMLKSLY